MKSASRALLTGVNVIALMTTFACKESSSFKGGSGKSAANSANAQDHDGPNSKGKSDTDGKKSPGRTKIDKGQKEGKRCLAKSVDLRVMFVLDSTGSMQNPINIVKSNMQAFANSLTGISFDSKKIKVQKVSVGSVIYRDNEDEIWQIPLGTPAELTSRLGEVVAAGGYDNPEGGLTAFSTALELLEEESAEGKLDLLPVVVVVTDTLSHAGGDVRRRACDPQAAGLGKLMASENFDKLVIYDGSPNAPVGVENCDIYNVNSSAAEQWNSVRELWASAKGDRGGAANGGNIGFPFVAEDLVTTLPEDIASSFSSCESK